MKLPVGYITGQGLHQATGFGGLGQKMMEQMGWSKGTGLGKEGAGMKEAIVVKKREDASGVGAGNGWDWEMKFWEKAYNSAVSNVQPKVGDGSSSSDSDSDSDDDAPTAQQRSETSQNAAVNRDGTVASASAAELQITAELAKDPWGRWGGKKGKMARIAAQEQREQAGAAHALGIPVRRKAATASKVMEAAAAAAAAAKLAQANTESGQDTADASADVKQKRGKKRKAAAELASSPAPPVAAAHAAAAAPQRQVIVVELSEPEAIAQFRPQAAAGWWGSTMFRSSGCLEGLDKKQQRQQQQGDVPPSDRPQPQTGDSSAPAASGAAPSTSPAIAVHAFTEGDQEALYMQLHDKVSKGRSGLGKSGALKFAGGAWKGSKTTFGDDTGGASTAPEPLPVDVSEAPQSGAGAVTDKKQWLKRARALLKQAPKRRIKLKALGKQLQQLYAEDGSSAQQLVNLMQLQAAKTKQKKLLLDGKFLCLA